LQLAHTTAIVTNDGVAHRPHLVKQLENLRTGEVRSSASESTRTLAVKREHLEVIRNALVSVNKEGTSARAFAGAKYVSGGKTGTAQVFSLKGEKYEASKIDERLRDHAWFMAYAPADKPRIALAVLVENGGFGAQAAAPIARQVLDYYLLGEQVAGKQVAPTLPGGADPDDRSD